MSELEQLQKDVADAEEAYCRAAGISSDEIPFMPAYDINSDDGSARLNWLKAALLPEWRETFKKMDDKRKANEIK